MVSGPSWVVERARPIWDAQVQLFDLQYEPVGKDTGQFILHYNKDATPNFEGVPLGRAFYGCNRQTGRFSLMVLSHDLLAVPQLIQKTTALLGPPTKTTMQHQSQPIDRMRLGGVHGLIPLAQIHGQTQQCFGLPHASFPQGFHTRLAVVPDTPGHRALST